MDLLKKARSFALRHERHASSGAFALGFIWDSLTLTRVDMLYDNLVLTFYLAVATLGIVLFHAHGAGRLEHPRVGRFMTWLPLIIQFAFGGLFSGYVIYYSQSGTLIGSWPFLLFLLALFIGNEVFKKRYQLLTFQFSILFIAFFSYSIFSIPVLLRAFGTHIFLLSGVVSLLFTALITYIVYRIAPLRIREARESLTLSIVGLYLFFNLAYFLNIIPPIPLALKDLAIAHTIIRTDAGYALTYERPPWYRFFDETSRIYRMRSGEGVSAFSSVFAPLRLDTTILHRWSYYDDATDGWVVAGEIPFGIRGGRDEGYRGYSEKTAIFPGKWRLEVVTQNGQLIGRRTFRVVAAAGATPLAESLK